MTQRAMYGIPESYQAIRPRTNASITTARGHSAGGACEKARQTRYSNLRHSIFQRTSAKPGVVRKCLHSRTERNLDALPRRFA